MKPSYSKEAKCPCNYTSRSCNKPRCTVSYQDYAKLRRAIPFGWERTKHITSYLLGPLGRERRTPLHLFSEQEVKKTRWSILDRSMSNLPDWRAVHRQTIPIPCARTHSRPINLNARSAQSLVFFSRKYTKQTISSIQTTTFEKVDWSRLLFSSNQNVRAPFDS